jgi:acyl-CoA synthetase (AMP-forming)/AMP-acid ligase II
MTDPYRSFHSILADHAGRFPRKTFVHCIDQEQAITYGETFSVANRIARFLRHRGFTANDRLLLLAENSIEHVAAYLGVLRFGATLCSVNVEINRAHLAEIFRAVEPKLVLYQENLGLEALRDRQRGPWLALGEWSPNGGTGFFAEIETLSDADDLPSLAGRDDFAVIFYTSGTVAKPKGVIYTHATLFYNFDAVADMVGLAADDRILDFRSLSWISAMELGLGGPLTRGATAVLAKRFSSNRYFDWLRAFEINIGVCVPTGINMLINRRAGVRTADLPHLRFMTSSSAPLLLEQWKTFEELYGIPVAQGYGSSEGGWIAGSHRDNRRMGTVGRPLKYQTLRIVDQSGDAVPIGTIGEIQVAGAMQQGHGYLHPDGTIERLAEAGLRTGDLGFLDEGGYLYITGRAKDLVIRGGVNIAPMEIDNVLVAHPEIAEAATVGVPDPIYGEELVSYVTTRPDAALTADGVLAHCRAELPDFKMPKQVLFRKTLPKTDRGKLDRNALIEEWKRTHPET